MCKVPIDSDDDTSADGKSPSVQTKLETFSNFHALLSSYRARLPFVRKKWNTCASQFLLLLRMGNIDRVTLDGEVEKADTSPIRLPSGLLSPPCSLTDTTCLRPIPPMLRSKDSSF